MNSPEQEQPGLGICISGGGFRAALYGLGVFRYLAEAGQLRRVKVICSVSGGSLATGALLHAVKTKGDDALGTGFESAVFAPFVDCVSNSNLRMRAVRRWVSRRLVGGAPRSLVLGRTLGEALFPSLETLPDLPASPQAVITATDYWAGRAFRFSREFVGSFDAGYTTTVAEVRVSDAVAASVAAPPWIPALELKTAGLGWSGKVPPVLSLTDGGVYDNLGVEWFQGWGSGRPAPAVPASDLVVINASGVLQRDPRRLRGLRGLNRSRKIQYAQTQATRVRWFVRELEAGRQNGTYLGITGDPRRFVLPGPERIPVEAGCYQGALPRNLIEPLARLRTDLNKFSRRECELLAYHGYWSAHARYASLRPHQAVASPPTWTSYADLSEAEAKRLERELSGRRHRVGVGEQLR